MRYVVVIRSRPYVAAPSLAGAVRLALEGSPSLRVTPVSGDDLPDVEVYRYGDLGVGRTSLRSAARAAGLLGRYQRAIVTATIIRTEEEEDYGRRYAVAG